MSLLLFLAQAQLPVSPLVNLGPGPFGLMPFGGGGKETIPGPSLVSTTPVNGTPNVAPDAAIDFTVTADASIDPLATKVIVDGQLALVGITFMPGFTGSISTNAAGVTYLFTLHPLFTRKIVDIVIECADMLGNFGSFSFALGANVGQVTSLAAKTYCDGKRIDLSWANPSGATQVKIRRSSVGYCRFVDDPGTDIYTGAPITRFVDGVYVGSLVTSNAALLEGVFYYYTVFLSFSAVAPYVWAASLSAEVEGLSIKDYFTAEGDYVYALLPREVRRADSDSGRGTDQFKTRDYCRVLQCGINLYRGWLESLLLFRDPDAMPAGRIGDGANNYGILAAQLWDYGLPAGASLDAQTLRRLVYSLIGVYKNKGNCQGLIDLTKAATTWDARCDELIEPYCGVNRLATTYDNQSSINRFIASVTANDGTTSVLGQATLPSARLFLADGLTAAAVLPPIPAPAFVLDALGTYACVSSVVAPFGGAQVILFANAAAQLRKEITGTMSAGVRPTLLTIDTTSYPWQFPANLGFAAPLYSSGAFIGMKLMDSAGSIFTIQISDPDPSGKTVLTLSAAAAGGAFSIAAAFDPAGATFATRIPLLQAKVYTGEFSLTMDPAWDVRLKDETQTGPWSLLSSVTSTKGPAWSPTPVDVIVIAKNVHSDKGKALTVGANTITDTTKAWATNQWRGFYLLPDWNQPKLFRIVSNSATEIVVDIPPGAGGLDSLAQGGKSYYVVLTEKNGIRYGNVVAMLPSFVPIDMKPTVKFETV